MGKKATKRKTQWRTLAITECPQQNSKSALIKKITIENNATNNSVNLTSTTETNNVEEAISQDDEYSNPKSYTNPSYLKRKFSTSSDYRNDYRNNSSYSYNSKHNSTSSASSLYSSSRYSSSYRRRPFSSQQNGSGRFPSGHGADRTMSRGYRTSGSNRSGYNTSTKPLFNEDDYTRISTPRQDVIFKKGYFSQPKKYVSSTDTNTTSSTAASIVSAEESASTLSGPSLTPEQCSSLGDSLDPEQGYVYSFVDQNGVVYSYVPNGFDQYNGQMMMLPYGYPPYMCSPDVNSPTGSNEEESEQTRTPVESHETPSSDLNETKVIDEVPKDASSSVATTEEISASSAQEENNDNKCDEAEKEDVTTETTPKDENVENVDSTETSEMPKENEIIPDSVQNIPEQFYNYEYPPYYAPQILYPYMYPQQFVPVYGNEFDIPIQEEYSEEIEDQNRIRLRCRKKRRNSEGNSTGVSTATTEDESDQDESKAVGEENETNSAEQNVESPLNEDSTQLMETEQKTASLNANVKEFIPRGIMKSMLNANVQEFLPRNIKHSTSKQPVRNISQPTKKSASKGITKTVHLHELTKDVSISDNKTVTEPTPQKSVEKKPTELTLAEKIKQSLAQEAKATEKQEPMLDRPISSRKNTRKPSARKEDYSKNTRNTRPKTKKPEKTVEVKAAPPQPVQVPSQPSYAQIANFNVPKTEPNQLGAPQKESATVENKPTTPVGTSANAEKTLNLTTQPAETTSDPKSTEAVQKDIWQTVKHRGKRGKHAKELFHEEVRAENYEQPLVEKQPISASTEPSTDEVANTPKEDSIITEVIEIVTEPVESTPITTTPTSSKKKTSKSKNRKSAKKTLESTSKKKVKLELVEPLFELPHKTEDSNSDKIRRLVLPDPDAIDTLVDVAENEKLCADEEQDSLSFSSSPPEFSFDRIFLNKGFARSPMDILKGFDYTYKSKSILKEEEEMVLSVIKSISSNSTTPSPPKMSPVASVADDDSGDEKTVVENSATNRHENGSETDTVSELSIDGEIAGESDVIADYAEVEVQELNTRELDETDMEPESSNTYITENVDELGLENSKAVVETLEVENVNDDIEKSIVKQECDKTIIDYKETTEDIVVDENECEDVKSSAEITESTTENENTEEAPLDELTETPLTETGPVEGANNFIGTASDGQLVTNISFGEKTDSDEGLVIVNNVEIDGSQGNEQHINGCEESKLLSMDQQPPTEEKGLSETEPLVNGCENDKQHLDDDNLQDLSVTDEHVKVNGEVEEQTNGFDEVQDPSVGQCCTNGIEESAQMTAEYSRTNGCEEKSTEMVQEFVESMPNSRSTEAIQNGFKDQDEHFEHDITENIRKYILQCSRNSMSPRKELKSNNGYQTPENGNQIHQNGFHENEDEPEHTLISSDPTTPLDCTPRLSITNSDIIITTFEDYETSSQNSFDYDSSDYPSEKFDRELSRSLASSPFENKERILDELDDIVVPMLDAKGIRGSTDYLTCLNVLSTIIQSRECSLEPDRSPSADINRKYSLQPKPSRECSLEPSLKRQCSLEPTSRPCSAADYMSCVDSLNNLVKSRECSVEPEFLKREVANHIASCETKTSQNGLVAQTELENESSQGISKVNSDYSESISNEVIMNGFSRSSDAESGTMQDDSTRILNASISCDRSSGIGSDCDENQPSSPESTDTRSKSTTIGYLNDTAQSTEDMPRKQHFPINTAVSKDTRLSHDTHMPTNVLPNLSESNSVHCDNQSVSYTSSKRSLGSSVQSGTTADEWADKNDLVLSTNSKFPTSNEIQPNHFPITEAIKQWLVQESKEPTPEPLFRLPDDPGLKDFLSRRIKSSESRDDEKDWSSTDNDADESEDEYCDNQIADEVEADYLQKQRTNPKNLVGNPLHASSCKMISIESDSDYNSDSNDHHGQLLDDNTCKRVAKTPSDYSENLPDKNDLLEFWDDEFVRNPKRWLSPSASLRTDPKNKSTKSQDRGTSTLRNSTRSPSTDIEPYDSLYGKTIDYNQLMASNYEFLSNNILSYSKNEHHTNESDEQGSRENILRAVKQNYCAESKQSLSSNNTFYNDTNTYRSRNAVNSHSSARPEATTSTSSTDPNNANCKKPPEVCCILM